MLNNNIKCYTSGYICMVCIIHVSKQGSRVEVDLSKIHDDPRLNQYSQILLYLFRRQLVALVRSRLTVLPLRDWIWINRNSSAHFVLKIKTDILLGPFRTQNQNPTSGWSSVPFSKFQRGEWIGVRSCDFGTKEIRASGFVNFYLTRWADFFSMNHFHKGLDPANSFGSK